MDCPNPCPPSHPGYLPSLQDLVAGLYSPVPANRMKGVVYSTYIGQTGRSLDHRLREHHWALKGRDLGPSALAEHVFSLNHRVDLLKAMVIETHNHTQICCMLAGVLAHPALPVPTQQGEGYFARTPCCTTDLTMHPSGVLPLMCWYYYYYSHFPPLIIV